MKKQPLVKGGQGNPDINEEDVKVIDFDKFNDNIFKIFVIISILLLGIITLSK